MWAFLRRVTSCSTVNRSNYQTGNNDSSKAAAAAASAASAAASRSCKVPEPLLLLIDRKTGKGGSTSEKGY